MNHRIVLAAGGSGGHLFPAIESARALKNRGYQLHFCAVGLQTCEFFPKEEFDYHCVDGTFFSKKTMLFAPFKLIKGTVQAYLFLKKFKPSLVIGFGSYHSFPTTLAAALLKIPLFLFEPNIEMGRVNKVFSAISKGIFSYFDHNHSKYFKILPTKSYPVVDRDLAKKTTAIDTQKPIFLITGGSQGSLIVNQAVLMIEPEKLKKYYIVHLAGKNENLESLKAYYKKYEIEAFVTPFTNQMPLYLSIATIIFSRAGASTIYEALFYKIPAFLIPYGDDPQGHQILNARYLVEKIQGGLFLLQTNINKSIINSTFEQFERELFLYKSNLEFSIDIKKVPSMEELIDEFLTKGTT